MSDQFFRDCAPNHCQLIPALPSSTHSRFQPRTTLYIWSPQSCLCTSSHALHTQDALFSLTHLIRTQESCKSNYMVTLNPRHNWPRSPWNTVYSSVTSTYHLGQSLSIVFPGTSSLMFQGDHCSSHFFLHILVNWHVNVYSPACLPL